MRTSMFLIILFSSLLFSSLLQTQKFDLVREKLEEEEIGYTDRRNVPRRRRRLQVPAVGVSLGPSLRLRRPSPFLHRRPHLDHRNFAELLVSVLPVCDGDPRVSAVVDQGSVFHYEVVH
ncbi:hypothetical protein ACS0TY_002274 [Phlomoides rotata]